MRKILSLVILMLPLSVRAQNVKLISSSLQRWSGGVAGHRGENYRFLVDCPTCTQDPDFQKIWIGSIPFAFNAGDGNTTVKKILGNKQHRYEITVRITHDDYAEREKVIKGEVDTLMQPLPDHYKGRVFLEYKYDCRKRFLNIKSINSYLPDINYP